MRSRWWKADWSRQPKYRKYLANPTVEYSLVTRNHPNRNLLWSLRKKVSFYSPQIYHAQAAETSSRSSIAYFGIMNICAGPVPSTLMLTPPIFLLTVWKNTVSKEGWTQRLSILYALSAKGLLQSVNTILQTSLANLRVGPAQKKYVYSTNATFIHAFATALPAMRQLCLCRAWRWITARLAVKECVLTVIVWTKNSATVFVIGA